MRVRESLTTEKRWLPVGEAFPNGYLPAGHILSTISSLTPGLQTNAPNIVDTTSVESKSRHDRETKSRPFPRPVLTERHLA